MDHEPAHEPALLRSEAFSVFETPEFSATIARDIAFIIGCVYSASGAAKPLFGDR